MFENLCYELKLKIINEYLKVNDSIKIRVSNKLILDEINIIFENRIKIGGCKKISKIFISQIKNNINFNVIWEIPLKSIRICKKKKFLILEIGDFISYWNREEGVKITNFTGYEKSPGPIGFEYLPWIGNRFETPLISLRGNPRHVIAYPTGFSNYGEHINWLSIRKIQKVI